MNEIKYVSIAEAALIAGKSAQTIRRLIKTKKIKFRRSSTPQGFSYFVDLISLGEYFDTSLTEPAEKNIGVSSPKEAKESEYVSHEEHADVSTDQKWENDEGSLDSPSSPRLRRVARDDKEVVEFDELGLKKIPDENNGFNSSAAQNLKEHSQLNISDVLAQQQNMMFAEFNETVRRLIEQHESILHAYEVDKRNLFNMAEAFQKRIINLEGYIKQLEAPKEPQRRWYQFWR